MSTDQPINLARAAVLAEEFCASREGLTAEVVPATSLGLDPNDVTTHVADADLARIIVVTDPQPHPDVASLMNELAGSDTAYAVEHVAFATLPDPAAVVVNAGDDVVAVVFVSEKTPAVNHEPSAGLLNIGVLRHVPLEVAAELGRAKVTMEEILQYGPGSVIELDRTAGSPVDVVVNGSMIARGEVVVLGEEYGIRVTEILGRQ